MATPTRTRCSQPHPPSRQGRRALRRAAALALLAGAVAASHEAGAVTVELRFDQSVLDVGGTTQGTLAVSGLSGRRTDPTLRAFDIDVLFDPTVVGVSLVTFGSTTWGSDLDFGLAGSTQSVDSSIPGRLRLTETSQEPDDVLRNLQSDYVYAATLEVQALSPGTVAFDLEVRELRENLGGPLTPHTILTPTLEVRAPTPAVPEPGAALLFGAGALLVAARRRPRRSPAT